MSCRGDAYRPDEALTAEEAFHFHAWQAEKLAAAGLDLLLAATLPALSEATGLALALAATGSVPDQFRGAPPRDASGRTPLKEAIAVIDAAATPAPLAYLINCTHASFARSALSHETNSSDWSGSG